jgi:hypothetical protein
MTKYTTLSDDENLAGVAVRDDDGATFTIDLLAFEKMPLRVTITMPKNLSAKAIRKAIVTLAENEDVYIALVRDYLRDEVAPAKSRGKRKAIPLTFDDEPPF